MKNKNGINYYKIKIKCILQLFSVPLALLCYKKKKKLISQQKHFIDSVGKIFKIILLRDVI